jgi:hypothetical protein
MAVRRGPQPVGQIRQSQQALDDERAPAIGDDHERICGDHIGPASGKREQPAVLIAGIDPVLTPVAAMDHELKVTPGQRMERVRHPHTPVPIGAIRCSRRRGPTRSPNAGSEDADANSSTAPSSGPKPPAADPARVRDPPQPAPASPLPARRRAAETATRTSRPRPVPRPKTDSRWRPDQRILPGRMTRTRFSARTALRFPPAREYSNSGSWSCCWGQRRSACGHR